MPEVDSTASEQGHETMIRRLPKVLTYLFGGAVAVFVSLALQSHSAGATASQPQVSGYTLCASSTGAVTYVKTGGCGAGATKLTVSPESQVTTLTSEVNTLTGEVKTLKSQVSSLKQTLVGVSHTTVNGEPTLLLSGENLQVVNGTGSEETTNGVGNVIVGYNETPGIQTGSHNLVIGNGQSFSSYGGLLAGEFNLVSGPFGTASGGEYNVASDNWSSVTGGCDNIAGQGPVPTGPCSDQAETVVGGVSNDATGLLSSILGGQGNSATGDEATVSGGVGNYSSGTSTSVLGGYSNTAGSQQSSISGGGENTTTGEVSSIAGGYYNTATADEATVAGGCSNLAGPGNLFVNAGCTEFGSSFMTVLGGIGNESSSVGSTISGGTGNFVSGGQTSSIAGGHDEQVTSTDGFQTRAGDTTFNP
jgi:hypothetical protein